MAFWLSNKLLIDTICTKNCKNNEDMIIYIFIFVLQENAAEMLCWSAKNKQDISPWPRVLKTLKH